ncbi:DUF2891 family protein [candidate division KSB1 bacterium]|nr:DUF2891 family protein [candidate division KSB1 bacterium]
MEKSICRYLVVIAILIAGISCENHQSEFCESSVPIQPLDLATASEFAQLALNCLQTEFPNKPGHVINSPTDVRRPSELHPAFFGCYDWHSAVHGHWLLVRLLKRFPDLPKATAIRQVLNHNLTKEKIEAEAAYFSQPNRLSFERTYGWAWLLKLAEELHGWQDPDALAWSANLQPLADLLVQRYRDFLPRQTYPIRTGVHPNTAFGLSFALDYARAVDDTSFAALLIERCRFYFFSDRDYPIEWEPGGEDFFSPALMEANLMRRVLSSDAYRDWLEGFLPVLFSKNLSSVLDPAQVSDRSDPKIVHLDGLNLSRAWCLCGIARTLPKNSVVHANLLAVAAHHAQATLDFITSGQYEGEHWLASFALYYFSEAEEDFPGAKSRYHGFARYNFIHRGRAAIIVAPDTAAIGLPWIWRARFFDHEPQTDLALIRRGFHLATIDVSGLYGSPQAVEIWNDFYDYLTERFGFCRKPALEGLSRGGLIIYNWATKNPDKVSCLYGDAPVCDLKSWPGPDRIEMMQAYGFKDRADFFSYSGNPVDNLQPLVDADVPILHVVGESDIVVPVAQNSDIVEQRYRQLGGRIKVIRKPGVGHHPHSLVDPTPIVDFILHHIDCP